MQYAEMRHGIPQAFKAQVQAAALAIDDIGAVIFLEVVGNDIEKEACLGCTTAEAHHVYIKNAGIAIGSYEIVEKFQSQAHALVEAFARNGAAGVRHILVGGADAGDIEFFPVYILIVDLVELQYIGNRTVRLRMFAVARPIKRKQDQPVRIDILERIVCDIGVAVGAGAQAQRVGRQVTALGRVVIALVVVVQARFLVGILARQAPMRVVAVALGLLRVIDGDQVRARVAPGGDGLAHDAAGVIIGERALEIAKCDAGTSVVGGTVGLRGQCHTAMRRQCRAGYAWSARQSNARAEVHDARASILRPRAEPLAVVARMRRRLCVECRVELIGAGDLVVVDNDVGAVDEHNRLFGVEQPLDGDFVAPDD